MPSECMETRKTIAERCETEGEYGGNESILTCSNVHSAAVRPLLEMALYSGSRSEHIASIVALLANKERSIAYFDCQRVRTKLARLTIGTLHMPKDRAK